MRRILAWICVVGGFLWGIKPVYDALFNGRRMNTGYVPSDPTDYISFVFPLLCTAGLVALYARYGHKIKNSVILLIVSVWLSGCYHFFEIYYYGSGLPFGFIFLFTSILCMIVGALYLFIQLRKVGDAGRLLSWAAILLFIDNLLLLASGFLSELLPETLLNACMFILMIAIGFIWAVLGWGVLQVSPKNTGDMSLAKRA